MRRFYADTNLFSVEEVECEEKGYPHRDARDRQQWDNSHFDDEKSAWLFLQKEADACIFLTLSEIKTIDARRRRLTEGLVAHAEARQRVRLAIEKRWGDDEP